MPTLKCISNTTLGYLSMDLLKDRIEVVSSAEIDLVESLLSEILLGMQENYGE